MSDIFAWGVGVAEIGMGVVALTLAPKQWLKLDSLLSTLAAVSTIPFAMKVQRMEVCTQAGTAVKFS
jgi:hypothetical protein